MDQITESDILAGRKTITLETRSGKNTFVTVHALPWRDVLRLASEPDLAKRNLETIELGVEKEQIITLDLVTPDSIGQILAAINILTNGIPFLKKNQALIAKLSPQHSTLDPRISPTTSTPNPHSSNEATPTEHYERGRQLKSSSPSAAPITEFPEEICASSSSPSAADPT